MLAKPFLHFCKNYLFLGIIPPNLYFYNTVINNLMRNELSRVEMPDIATLLWVFIHILFNIVKFKAINIDHIALFNAGSFEFIYNSQLSKHSLEILQGFVIIKVG